MIMLNSNIRSCVFKMREYFTNSLDFQWTSSWGFSWAVCHFHSFLWIPFILFLGKFSLWSSSKWRQDHLKECHILPDSSKESTGVQRLQCSMYVEYRMPIRFIEDVTNVKTWSERCIGLFVDVCAGSTGQFSSPIFHSQIMMTTANWGSNRRARSCWWYQFRARFPVRIFLPWAAAGVLSVLSRGM